MPGDAKAPEPSSIPVWGTGGREFKSPRSDHFLRAFSSNETRIAAGFAARASRSFQHHRDSIGSRLVRAADQVSVNVERDCRLAVSETAANGENVNARPYEH
jgi:hypothetical protein